MMSGLLIRGGTIVNEGESYRGWIVVENERIARTGRGDYPRPEFDGETMMDAEREQKARVLKLSKRLAAEGIDALTLAAGTCTICEKCTYPDEPCRHPENRLVSMEAAGFMVYQVCEVADVPYNHGPLTISYTSAVLL